MFRYCVMAGVDLIRAMLYLLKSLIGIFVGTTHANILCDDKRQDSKE